MNDPEISDDGKLALVSLYGKIKKIVSDICLFQINCGISIQCKSFPDERTIFAIYSLPEVEGIQLLFKHYKPEDTNLIAKEFMEKYPWTLNISAKDSLIFAKEWET